MIEKGFEFEAGRAMLGFLLAVAGIALVLAYYVGLQIYYWLQEYFNKKRK